MPKTDSRFLKNAQSTDKAISLKLLLHTGLSVELGLPEGSAHLDKGDRAIRITECLYHSLRWYQVCYAVGGCCLLLCLLILKGIK